MNEFFQMSAPAAFVLAVVFGSIALAIGTFATLRNAKRNRELEHEERMTSIPLDANVRLADIQGKWQSAASAKQIEGRVERPSEGDGY